METLTSRMQAVQSPLIPIIGELIRSNPGTISLGQGVVYYGPPPEAIALLPEFLADPENHKYKPVEGIASNPTGAVYSEEALREVNQICRDAFGGSRSDHRGIYHISDEAYEYFTYNGIKHVSPGAFLQSSEHTISLYSLSKAYGFASWRIGYMVIPEHLLVPVKKIQDTILICPPVVSQYVALGALQVGVSYCKEHVGAIASVQQLVLDSLKRLEGLCTIAPADGAFYFFLKVDTQLGAFELTRRLIREHQVAVMPGTTFGMDDGCYLRVAYGALQKETVAEGIERLVQGLQSILASENQLKRTAFI